MADCAENKEKATPNQELLSDKPASAPDQQKDSPPSGQPAEERVKESTGPAIRAEKPRATISGNSLTFSGKTYPVFRSGGLMWMAKNLDYQVAVGSSCYGGNAANCQKHGRLYTWAAAKKACAAMGWRLPAAGEWEAMAMQGLDGFSAQLGGWRDDGGGFKFLDKSGYYWSSAENALGLIHVYYFTGGEMELVKNDPRHGYLCRCVK